MAKPDYITVNQVLWMSSITNQFTGEARHSVDSVAANHWNSVSRAVGPSHWARMEQYATVVGDFALASVFSIS